MDIKRREELDAELEYLDRKYIPGQWQGEPYELLQDYDHLGFKFEGNLGERVVGARDAFLGRQQDKDRSQEDQAYASRDIPAEEKAGLRHQYNAEHENRVKGIEQNPQWLAERRYVEDQFTQDAEYIWQRVAEAQERAARANGIDLDKLREDMRLDNRAAALATTARPPQELPLWEAALRREDHQDRSTLSSSDKGKAFLDRLKAADERAKNEEPEQTQTKRRHVPFMR